MNASVVLTCVYCGNQAFSAQARICSRCGRPLAGMAAGTLLGGCYRIVRRLTSGGQGAIYVALDERALGRKCIVKELLPHADPNNPREVAETMARFEAEARVLTRLRHPNTPQVYAYLREDDRLFIVMEYITGSDLEQGLTRVDDDGRAVPGQPRPLKQALQDGIEVCKILKYLAAQNPPVVHHDIKPANLIRDTESDAIFLVDFGAVARSAGAQSVVGSIYGTPGYAAPEFYDGQSHPKGDVYSLAASLYHMLTDDDPRDHPGTFPQLDSLPPPVATALRKALETELARRSGAPALLADLEQCLQQSADRSGGIVFPDGSRPSTPQELAQYCQRWWASGLALMQDGKIAQFLQQHGLADEARLLARTAARHPDQRLDGLLRRLDPSLPVPMILVGAQELNMGGVPLNSPNVVQSLQITNVGGLAEIGIAPRESWLQVHPSWLTVRPGEQTTVHVALNPDQAPHGNIQGHLELQISSQDALVTTRKVEVKANVGARAGKDRGFAQIIWLMMIMTGTFVAITLLWALRPHGWAIYSLMVLGAAVGGLVSWIQLRKIDMIITQMGLGIVGAMVGGVLLPVFMVRSASGSMTPAHLVLALAGSIIAPLLLSLFVDP